MHVHREVTKGDNNKSFVPPETRDRGAQQRTGGEIGESYRQEKKCLEAELQHYSLFFLLLEHAVQDWHCMNLLR